MRDILVPGDLFEYTSFGAPIDLHTARNRPAYTLKCTGAGTINVKMASSGGATRALTVTDGEEVLGQFMSIESVSGVTRVRAGWN